MKPLGSKLEKMSTEKAIQLCNPLYIAIMARGSCTFKNCTFGIEIDKFEIFPFGSCTFRTYSFKIDKFRIFAFGSCTFRSCNVGSCSFEKVLSKFKNCTLKLYTFEIDTFGTCTLRCHPFGSCTFESYTSEGTTYEGVTFEGKTPNSCYYYDDDGRVLFYSMIFMICHTTQCLKITLKCLI